jgi:glycine/D-amino acid oxidase-like deaminating enzyme
VSLPAAATPRTVLVLGGSLLGACTAWALRRRGHRVQLLDPGGNGGGSWAALGVLMGQVFHRSSGRGWRLRQRSLTLWRDWIPELEGRGRRIPHRTGLLLLAADAMEEARLRRLAEERQARGIPLDLWEPQRLGALAPALPAPARLGLFSPLDGQLDPAAAITAFRADGRTAGVEAVEDRAVALEPLAAAGWRVERAAGDPLEADWLVVAAGIEALSLLEPLGFHQPLEPVLGQALELELPAPAEAWPGVVAWRGCNLIPRPDLTGGRRLWLGATLEPGFQPDPAPLAALRHLHGDAPAWLSRACVLRQWQGLRPRPVGRPAPLLELLAPGLLLATGHYRNGVLLAPASAEWVVEQVERA